MPFTILFVKGADPSVPGIEKLSFSKIARITKPDKYGDGGGLYLQVTKSLIKSWIFRHAKDGVEHSLGLGPLHTVGLEEARN